jgi:hypothetical protein
LEAGEGEIIVEVVGGGIVKVLFLRQKTIRRIKMVPPTMPGTTPLAMVPTLRVEALKEGALMTVVEGFEESTNPSAYFRPTINDSDYYG